MELYLDSANIDAIRDAAATNIISGVFTSPTNIARENRPLEALLADIRALLPDGIICVQVISADYEGILAEAQSLGRIGKCIELKIPMCPDGLRAVAKLGEMGLRTNCVPIYTAAQALLAARASAARVSVRMDGEDDPIDDITAIFSAHQPDTRVLACGFRDIDQITRCARAGVHAAAIAPEMLWQMMEHPLTTKALDQYASDWDALLNRL